MKQKDIEDILHNSNQQYNSLFFYTRYEQRAWTNRVKKQSRYKQMMSEIKEEAEKLLHTPMKELSYSLFKMFHETGSRQEYEAVYFDKRRRLNTFALMVLIEGKDSYFLEPFEDIVWSICNEFTWCLPAHLDNDQDMKVIGKFPNIENTTYQTIDLFASETAFALSEILQLTKDQIDPLLNKRILKEVYKRIILPYMKYDFHWEKANHNWASVCGGSIGSMALHLFEDNQELSALLKRVLDTMDSYLDGFNDDGVCLEGYEYWQYGFGYYVYFSDLLKRRTQDKINLFKLEKVRKIALFQQKIFMNEDQLVNFSDSPPTASIYIGLSHYLSNIYSDFQVPEYHLRALYTDDKCSRWPTAFRNLLWFKPTKEGRLWQAASYYFEESQWLISRYLSDGGYYYTFAAKGGHNNEPHNHNDIGHFMLSGGRDVILKDLGSGLYNKDYFSDQRYTFICNSSAGHSVPIINNRFQSPGREYFASIKDVMIDEKEVKFNIDMTNAYPLESLHQLNREFTFSKVDKPSLELFDTYIFSVQPSSIVERLIVPSVDIKEEFDALILEGKSSKLRITFDRERLSVNINEFEFLNHDGQTETNMSLDFSVKMPEEKCFVWLHFQFM